MNPEVLHFHHVVLYRAVAILDIAVPREVLDEGFEHPWYTDLLVQNGVNLQYPEKHHFTPLT